MRAEGSVSWFEFASARPNNPGMKSPTGATRLQAGTATKLAVNLVTTLAIVRVGKVMGNLMGDGVRGNAKLRMRAVRIARALTGVDAAAAETALVRNGWVIKSACHRSDRSQFSPAPETGLPHNTHRSSGPGRRPRTG